MKEIQQLEAAVMILARAIESGRTSGLLEEVKEVMGYSLPKDHGKDVCICGHCRELHGKSHSINYTDGACIECRCVAFLMK